MWLEFVRLSSTAAQVAGRRSEAGHGDLPAAGANSMVVAGSTHRVGERCLCIARCFTRRARGGPAARDTKDEAGSDLGRNGQSCYRATAFWGGMRNAQEKPRVSRSPGWGAQGRALGSGDASASGVPGEPVIRPRKSEVFWWRIPPGRTCGLVGGGGWVVSHGSAWSRPRPRTAPANAFACGISEA